MRNGVAHGGVTGKEVGTVAPKNTYPGEVFDDSRDVAAGSLEFHRYRDGVSVVFNQVQHRELFEACRVERFPELALARGAVANRDVDHLV